jgi:flavin-dependent dehydrogenase
LRAAAEAGARVLQPCRATGAIIEDARVAGIETETGPIRARFVIDAGGSRHWLRRQVGIGMRRASRRLIATYGYAIDAAGVIGDDPVLTGDDTGWSWVARVRPDRVAWVQLDFTKLRREPPESLRWLQTAGPVRGADVTWRILEACAGEGFFIVGDAAAVIDPAASHGVLKAIKSGILAADLIVRVMRGETTESGAAAAFHSWTREWFERDCQRLSQLYAAANAAESFAGRARINRL